MMCVHLESSQVLAEGSAVCTFVTLATVTLSTLGVVVEKTLHLLLHFFAARGQAVQKRTGGARVDREEGSKSTTTREKSRREGGHGP